MIMERDASSHPELKNPTGVASRDGSATYSYDLSDDIFNKAFSQHDASNIVERNLGGGLGDYNSLVNYLKSVAAPVAPSASSTVPETPGTPVNSISPLMDAILNPSANPNLPVTSHPLQAILQPTPDSLTPDQQSARASQNNYDIMNVPQQQGSLMDMVNGMYQPNLAPLNTVNRQYFPQEMDYFKQYGRMPEYNFFSPLTATHS